jgi:hypothetical protein
MEAAVKRKLLYAALTLVGFGVVMRLLPHPDNLAPVGAIALFGGAVLPRKYGWWLPLAVMAVSDYVIGFYAGLVFNWGALLLAAFYGMLLRHSSNWFRMSVGALVGGLIFFAVSNFGVWLQGGLYPHTWDGLARCYVMALPFLKNTLLGNLLYGVVLFGVYALAARSLGVVPQHQPEGAPEPK